LKASAIDFIRRGTSRRRGNAVQHGYEPGDRRETMGLERTVLHHQRVRLALERAPVIRQMLEQASAMRQRMVERLGLRQGPSLHL
jgi:hypothetical protein